MIIVYELMCLESSYPAEHQGFEECGGVEIEDLRYKFRDSAKALEFPVISVTDVRRLHQLVRTERIVVRWKEDNEA